VCHQILSTALARYRREWNYALRYKPSPADLDALSRSDDQAATDHEEERPRRSIRGLSEADRQMVERLFWERWTEEEVAGCLGISQQAVSRRKRKILLALRQSLKADGM
jgi:RNA polymerase sigma factor (sigma-70 family)